MQLWAEVHKFCIWRVNPHNHFLRWAQGTLAQHFLNVLRLWWMFSKMIILHRAPAYRFLYCKLYSIFLQHNCCFINKTSGYREKNLTSECYSSSDKISWESDPLPTPIFKKTQIQTEASEGRFMPFDSSRKQQPDSSTILPETGRKFTFLHVLNLQLEEQWVINTLSRFTRNTVFYRWYILLRMTLYLSQ